MLIWMLVRAAFAQDFTDADSPALNAQLWRPPVDAQATQWTDDAGLAPNLSTGGRIAFGYVNSPLRYVYDEGERAGEPVMLLGNALQTDLIGHVTLWRFRVGVDLPFYMVTTGAGGGGGGLGDAAVDVKGVFLDREVDPIGLAFGARTTFPTATVDMPVRTEGVAYELQAIADRRFGDLLLAANVGTRGLPRVELENVTFDDQVFWRVGGGYALTPDAGVSLDVAGHANYAAPLDVGTSVPLEAMIGGWGRVYDALTLRGGVGTGLTGAVGAPAARVVLMASYEPPRAPRDRDLDGLVDPMDACPTDPEDFDGWLDEDGCPEPDNDADSYLDPEDGCPNDPEDFDGYRDEDGCPDPYTRVTIRTVDPSNLPVMVATWIEGDGIDQTINAYEEFNLHPGYYDLIGRAEGYAPFSASIEVPEVRAWEHTEVLTPLAKVGTVKVAVVDQDGRAVPDVRFTFGTDDPVGLAEGSTVLKRSAGEYHLSAEADGFMPGKTTVKVVEGVDHEARIVLDRMRVIVTRTKIELKDTVYFDTNKASIKPMSFSLLDEVVHVLQKYPNLAIRIEGHTDSRGSDTYNLDLSDRRAASVREYLVAHGIAAERLQSVGYGETRPVDPRETADAWNINRRVDFMVVNEETSPAEGGTARSGGAGAP